ncbi:MAG: DEAD/DEAH box helicase [Pseudobdellovibrionaceae bacterium]
MSVDSVFSQWGLSNETLLTIQDMGYESPTPVQNAVIPHLLKNQTDLLALAKTGTGKTAAFGIPLVEKLEAQKGLQALVLCPTRELAQQVAQSLSSFGQRKGIRVTTVLGGESYRKQIDSLRRNPEILVSTPGRLIDLMDQKVIKLQGVKYLVLDEADEMLSFGFQEALETVWTALKDEPYNTWLFSATMSDSIKRLTSKHLTTPYEVSLNTSTEATRVQSYAAVVYEEDKEDALTLLLKNTPEFYGIIFAQTKKQVGELEIKFRAMGLQVDSLHGDKVQADRTRVINRMKRKEIQILVATDVAARGLDIEDLTHVVNFEIPWDAETYTHRIGRTARAGKTGIVWTLVRPKEAHQLRKFERALKQDFQPLAIPSVKDVRKNQIRTWIKSLSDLVVPEKDQELFQEITLDLQVEDQFLLSTAARDWLFKSLYQSKIGADFEGNQPRSFDLRPRDNSTGSRAFGDRPRQHSGVTHARRDRGFGSDSRPPRREFSGDRPARSEGGFDRPQGGFDRPRLSGGGFDRDSRPPRREFSGDRPARTEGSWDRPRPSFGGFDRDSRPPRREFSGDRPERSFRPMGEGASSSTERGVGGFRSEPSSGGGERPPFRGARSNNKYPKGSESRPRRQD